MSARAKSRRRKSEGAPFTMQIVLLAVAIALGAFGIGYGVTALAFSRGSAPARVATVPDVRDLPETDARRAVIRSGLGLEIGDSLPNVDVPPGHVLAQSPLPGREVGPGTNVRVILSSGRPQPQVPEIEAMPLALATRAVQALGFDVEIEEVPSEAQVGRIVEVYPPVGSPVRLPATVHLRVSGGPPYVYVPVLLGLREDAAREALEELGLRLGVVEYERIDIGDEGHIVAQQPAAGDSVAIGEAVHVRISMRAALRRPGAPRGSTTYPELPNPQVAR